MDFELRMSRLKNFAAVKESTKEERRMLQKGYLLAYEMG
jgi:hypothetical protein